MRIQFQVEGGLAHFPGLSRPVTIDTASLPSSEASELEGLVQRARFFTLPAQVGGPPKPDARTYTISVEAAGRTTTVKIFEPIEDSALQSLVDKLRARQRGVA